MKIFLLFIACFFSFSAFGQNSYTVKNGHIASFDATYSFSKTCMYDHDLKRQYNNLPASSTLVIKVNQEGTGALIIYFQNKTRFTILSAEDDIQGVKFSMLNQNGVTVQAMLMIENERVKSFWLYNDRDNSSVIFFD